MSLAEKRTLYFNQRHLRNLRTITTFLYPGITIGLTNDRHYGLVLYVPYIFIPFTTLQKLQIQPICVTAI